MRTISVTLTSRKKQKNFSVLKKRSVSIRSPAKLNLYLNILGKYRTGFHRIESIVTRINLFDEIIIRINETDRIVFSCTDKTIENENNLCVKAARLLQRQLNLKVGFRIHLKKVIPPGSGMGGASSNAAATVMGINNLLNLNLNDTDFLRYGSRLGSDVNFFFTKRPWAVITSRGEKVEPIPVYWRLFYLVIYPGIRLSTAAVYRESNLKLTKYHSNVNILKYALKKKDFHLVKKLSFNCLEKSALGISARLRALKKRLEEEELFCLLTGSGSAFFVPFGSKKSMETTGNALGYKLSHQGYTVFRVQTY